MTLTCQPFSFDCEVRHEEVPVLCGNISEKRKKNAKVSHFRPKRQFYSEGEENGKVV